jgi:hypothetical protein
VEAPSHRRRWLAAVAVVLLVLAVWKFIDWRMQPPPPPATHQLPPR